MQSHPLLVLAVDGLRASALGAYGNTSYSTPAFDHLASEGRVYDRYLVDSSELTDVVTALWTGRHASLGPADIPSLSLPREVRGRGARSLVVTDEPLLTQHPVASDWDEIVLLERDAASPASDAFETTMGEVLASALEVAVELTSRPEPALLWIHLRGMQAPWDAPHEYADTMRDEEDPEWEPTTQVPRHAVDPTEGDDQIFVATCRYAAQVMALDECLGAMLAQLDSKQPKWNVLAMGLRGFPLGEHGWVGTPVPYAEQFHTPLIYRRADRLHRLTRTSELVQPSDLFPWTKSLAEGETPFRFLRPLAIVSTSTRTALVTPDWMAVEPASDEESADWELYVEPDDRWQANNVASLCEREVEQFAQVREQLRQGMAIDDLPLPSSEPVR